LFRSARLLAIAVSCCTFLHACGDDSASPALLGWDGGFGPFGPGPFGADAYDDADLGADFDDDLGVDADAGPDLTDFTDADTGLVSRDTGDADIRGFDGDVFADMRAEDDFRIRLAAAGPDDTVVVSGELGGSFEVPSGVTVDGGGEARITAEGGSALYTDVASGDVTSLVDLTIRVPAGQTLAGVLGYGSGCIYLDGVTIELESGIGLITSGLECVELFDVNVTGVLDDAGDAALSNSRRINDGSVAGLVMVGGAERTVLTAEGVEISDVGGFGLLAQGVSGDVASFLVDGVGGVGLLASESDLTLLDGVIRGTRATSIFDLADTAFGSVATLSSRLEAERVQLFDNAGFGWLQHDSEGRITSTRVVANQGPGVWVQRASGAEVAPFEMRDSLTQRNRGAGIALVDVSDSAIERVAVLETWAQRSPNSRRIRGDAVLAAATGDSGFLSLANVASAMSGRLGLSLSGDVSASTAVSTPTTLCGHSQTDPAWSCDVRSDAVNCVRLAGPTLVDPASWTCRDGSDGLSCFTSDAGLRDAEARPDRSVPESAVGASGEPVADDDACAVAVGDLLSDIGLAAGPGLVNGDGEIDPESVVGENGPAWICGPDGAGWRCNLSHSDGRLDDLDNPTWADSPGWQCTDVSRARACRYMPRGVGLAPPAAIDRAGLELDPALADRDAADPSEPAAEQPVSSWILDSLPVEGPVVADDGFVTDRGVLLRPVLARGGFR